jgi:LSD1 subclass zinc finger protein
MPIPVTSQCGKRFAAQDQLAGKRVQCPSCGQPLAIPAGSAAAQDHVRCQYCHQPVPRAEYAQHVDLHIRPQADGQRTDYATLPPDQREGNWEEAPRWYRHSRCGHVTGMPEEIIQTYLQDPWFYLSDKTFCTGCGRHVRQGECVWVETGENLQTYTDRLRAAKPQFRPGALRRLMAAIINAVVR